MNEHIDQLMQTFKTIVHDQRSLEMKAYAEAHDVPIIQEIGLELMLQLLRIKAPASILEIGSAIGYSAMMMARHLPKVQITTIERDPVRYAEANKFLENSEVKNRILLLEADALEISNEELPLASYDVIFIDAAKAQYQKFFEKYAPLLKDDGMIISDNLLFHGLVFETEAIESRNLRRLVQKINHYNEWLAKHLDYDTVLLPIGDGLAISKKKTEVQL